jgi:hypothetical protein
MGAMAANFKNTETSGRRRLLGSSSDRPVLAYIYTDNECAGDKERVSAAFVLRHTLNSSISHVIRQILATTTKPFGSRNCARLARSIRRNHR